MLNHPFGFWVGSGIGLGSITMFIGDLHLVKVISCVKFRPRKRTITCGCSRLAGAVALLEGDIEQARQFFLKSLRITRKAAKRGKCWHPCAISRMYILRGGIWTTRYNF